MKNKFNITHSKSQLAGMTVNERLSECGITKDFYKAVSLKDVKTAEQILTEIFVDKLSIQLTLEKIKNGDIK